MDKLIETKSIMLDEVIPGIGNTTGIHEVIVVGNLELLSEPKAAIFNSRQGKTPDSAAAWLRTTIDLSEELVKNGAALISSLGMVTWELVSWNVSECGGGLILMIPDIDPNIIQGMAGNILEEFKLDSSRVLMIFPDPETEIEKKYRRFPKRDFWIAALADRIYPVSVRSSGNQSRIVELFSIIPGKVVNKFQIDYEKPAGTSFHPAKLPSLRQEEDMEWDYLTHWTRTSITPWPGESKADYYRALAEAGYGYPHDGFHTLGKILRDMRITGSDKLIRGGFEMVSLTECPPWGMSDLIKWRPSLLRWTFEPYGIAMKREKLEEMGARKVIYGFDYQYRFLQGEDRAFFQATDPEGKNWREEKEWRFPEDIDLKKFAPEDVKIIVQTFEEEEELNEWSPFPVTHWEEFGLTEDEGE